MAMGYKFTDLNFKGAVDWWLSDPEAAAEIYDDISDWDVSGITDMNGLFSGDELFNGDLSKWDVSGVETMANMFSGAKAFNSDLSKWDVSNVESMFGMFNNADSFNSDISRWDVSAVTNMAFMFYNGDSSSAFNQDISNWDVSSVQTMAYMFHYADAFKQNLCWNINNNANTHNMMEGSNGCVTCCDEPTASPTRKLTEPPTPIPTKFPTPNPTPHPTWPPTSRPTEAPTPRPTKPPSANPTPAPSQSSTLQPTSTPKPTILFNQNTPLATPTMPPAQSPTKVDIPEELPNYSVFFSAVKACNHDYSLGYILYEDVVNERTEYNKTALILASENGCLGIARMLIEAEAQLDLQDDEGKTALMYSIIYGHDQITALLLQAGANLAIVDSLNRDAWWYSKVLGSLQVLNTGTAFPTLSPTEHPTGNPTTPHGSGKFSTEHKNPYFLYTVFAVSLILAFVVLAMFYCLMDKICSRHMGVFGSCTFALLTALVLGELLWLSSMWHKGSPEFWVMKISLLFSLVVGVVCLIGVFITNNKPGNLSFYFSLTDIYLNCFIVLGTVSFAWGTQAAMEEPLVQQIWIPANFILAFLAIFCHVLTQRRRAGQDEIWKLCCSLPPILREMTFLILYNPVFLVVDGCQTRARERSGDDRQLEGILQPGQTTKGPRIEIRCGETSSSSDSEMQQPSLENQEIPGCIHKPSVKEPRERRGVTMEGFKNEWKPGKAGELQKLSVQRRGRSVDEDETWRRVDIMELPKVGESEGEE